MARKTAAPHTPGSPQEAGPSLADVMHFVAKVHAAKMQARSNAIAQMKALQGQAKAAQTARAVRHAVRMMPPRRGR